MIKSRKLTNCPPDYYQNCNNAQVKCKQCIAGGGKTDLFYVPYASLDLPPHPAGNWQQVKYQRQKQQRQARKTENDIANTLAKSLVKKTQRSGAANHDGDLAIATSEDRDIRIEVKRRGIRKSWNVTTDEFDKGLKQGIDVFAIEIERPDTGERQTLFCVTEDFFTSLVSTKLNTTELSDK